MANTCDYCHKPLSLMRRLRGEQFCSVEHLDLYTAQQAEFALQRLAASVEDKPIHQRPPALLKRIARTPAQANGSDSSQRSRNGAGGHDVLTEAPPVDYMHLAHETPLAPAPPAYEPPPVVEEPAPVDYPVASFAPPAPIHARAPRSTAPAAAGPSEAPIDSWKPRLDIEPALAPPMAPMHELPQVTQPGSVRSLDAEPEKTLHEARFPNLSTEAPMPEPDSNPGLIELSINPAQAPQFELLARPVDLPAEFTAPKPSISALQTTESDLLFQPPHVAALRTATLRLLASHSKPAGLADFAPILNFDPAVSEELGGPVGELPPAPRIPWTPRPVAPAGALNCGFGPLEPRFAGETSTVEMWPGPDALAHPRVPLADPAHGLSVLDRIRVQSGVLHLPPASGNIEAQGLAPRLRDFRARLAARLNAGNAQPHAAWTAPRADATSIDPGAPATAHPALVPAGLRIAPLSPPSPASLSYVGPALTEQSPLMEPDPPVSTPDSWKYPEGTPCTGIDLEPSTGLVPGPISPNAPFSPERPALQFHAEPLRYCPASLVSLPDPNYRPVAPWIVAEGRFVALTPNGIFRLPRIQYSGYRMPGPYPKVPAKMPDLRSNAPAATVPPPDFSLPIIWTWTRDANPSVPSLESPAPARLHPADFFSWPSIKTPRTERILPLRETDTVLGPPVGTNLTARRFGPARAGLQRPLTGADLSSRTGA